MYINAIVNGRLFDLTQIIKNSYSMGVQTIQPLTGLARRLVNDSILSSDNATQALHAASKQNVSFISYAVQEKLVSAYKAATAVADEFGAPLLDLDEFDLSSAPLDLVPEELIRKHSALPLMKRNNRIYIAVADPTNIQGLDEIKFQLGLTAILEGDLRVIGHQTIELAGHRTCADIIGQRTGATLVMIYIQIPRRAVRVDRYAILTDIQGMEDALGDMDFKVAGTMKGVTAIQMDIKIKGLSREILAQALKQAHEGRMHIMGKMMQVISEPRKELSPYAPRIISMHIKPDKIRDVIGPGGKMIKQITEETGAKIDIDNSGLVYIAAVDGESGQKAKEWIEKLTEDVEVGKTYVGKVTRIMNFGTFVEVLPGKEGLVHISQLAKERVEKVEDVVHVGDGIMVKCVEIDSQGRVNLSRKALLGGGDEGPSHRSRGPRGGHNHDRQKR